MKTVIILITLIAIQTICYAQKREVTIDVKIGLTAKWLRVELNDQQLSLITKASKEEMLNELSIGFGIYDAKDNRYFKSFNDFMERTAKEQDEAKDNE